MSFLVGSQPNKLAMSDTGEYLYVGLDGLPGVVRVHLPTRTVGTPFTLGDAGSFLRAPAVDDIEVLPGNPDAVAVARRYCGVAPSHAGVAVYDSGVERSTSHAEAYGQATSSSSARPPPASTASTTSRASHGFRRMDVTPTGVTVLDSTPGLIEGFIGDIEYRRRPDLRDRRARSSTPKRAPS